MGEVEQKLERFVNTAFESIHGKVDQSMSAEKIKEEEGNQVLTMT